MVVGFQDHKTFEPAESGRATYQHILTIRRLAPHVYQTCLSEWFKSMTTLCGGNACNSYLNYWRTRVYNHRLHMSSGHFKRTTTMCRRLVQHKQYCVGLNGYRMTNMYRPYWSLQTLIRTYWRSVQPWRLYMHVMSPTHCCHKFKN